MGPITITSTGDITTSGTFAAGINAGSIGTFGTTDGAITINSFGNITTSGNSAIGINASSVYGPITINSFGSVSVSGAASIGINAQTQGDVSISSAGSLTAGPNSSVGILALSQAGNVTIIDDRRHRNRRKRRAWNLCPGRGKSFGVFRWQHPDARRRFTGHHGHGFFRRGRCRHRQHQYDGCRVRWHLCSQLEWLGANHLDRRHSR